MPLPDGTRGILLDIEGTTTPISFVYDVLFPFAKSRLDESVARAGSVAEVMEAVRLLREEYEGDDGGDLPEFGNGAPYAHYLMERDRKSTGLKTLQGLIWREGYETEELEGQVFADVPQALEAWNRAGVHLRIFSSGSVLAQKLLFSHTDHGDLTPRFEGFHDTTSGPKKESRSYRAIAEAFGLPPSEILFLSDVVSELDAAREAGMQTGLFARPGNKPVPDHTHPTHKSFLELV